MSAEAVLRLDGVGLTYGSPHHLTVLSDVTEELGRGELVAIRGPSGAGKSSLLNVLGLLQRPTTGTYLVGGHDTGRMREAERSALRARTFGFVFQSFHLMAGRTARTNIELGMLYTEPAARRTERAEHAAAVVGIAHRLDHRPDEMSGGERQRVAIARALAPRPSVVFADEPTGNLDSASAEVVMDALETVRDQDVSVVVVTHSSEVAARCDRTILLSDGRIVPGAEGG